MRADQGAWMSGAVHAFVTHAVLLCGWILRRPESIEKYVALCPLIAVHVTPPIDRAAVVLKS
uniref:Uncharacterized protein n=1 Tax=uncultured marine virus TaxID=186617 RepID=A0A0F7L674_9VIRU|nr:hypothetical protein [uncultured marine virus]